MLAKKDVREPTNWSRRFKNHQEKLKSGDVYQVAEVVRNLALRDNDKDCPPARSRCSSRPARVRNELAFALDISEDDAMDRLSKTIARPFSPGSASARAHPAESRASHHVGLRPSAGRTCVRRTAART